ncbi:hypothetical protein QR98_0090390 [Sarcoptes scabiei]|uniref:BED-type domain-containing protein n=1 Tax=Sarcoptes scabiei TaxID=52283 RepID=A0A132AHT9_SARSC|nr:hypothetical protein QR98_0090390 [Sarcoptes scabiei]
MTAVVDENHQELTFELIDVKSLANSDLDDIVPNHSNSLDEENDYLKKEMKLLQEKCTILQAQVQHQSKLIELLIRLDMLKSYEDPDQKDLEDLHKKIHLCTNLTEEYAIKFQEICNEKRRILIPDNSHEPEKKSAIWDHFTVIINSEGAKTVRCNYCHKVFNHKQMNTNKCREHILEKCDEAPESLRTKHKSKSEPQVPKSKYSVWNHFTSTERDDRLFIVCSYCGIEYSSKNATKCREHLAFKCTKITDEARSEMRSTFSQEYIDALLNTTKRSTIWEHFCVYEDDDHKTMIQCIYCCMNYANKNATKCREHLLERCDKVPLSIQHQIRDSLYETPSKTWTQIKIPIWKHFSVMNLKGFDFLSYFCFCLIIYPLYFQIGNSINVTIVKKFTPQKM